MSEDPTQTARPETSSSARNESRGIAMIKSEYLIDPTPTVDSASSRDLNDDHTHIDDLAEGSTTTNRGDDRDSKRRKTGKPNKEERSGQNKARQFPMIRETGAKICRSWELTGECSRSKDSTQGCKYDHDWSGYFIGKPNDIFWDGDASLSDSSPFVPEHVFVGAGEDGIGKTVDLTTSCPVLKDLGYCPYGWRCRFLGGHIRKRGGMIDLVEDGMNKVVEKLEGETRLDIIGDWQVLERPTLEQQEMKNGWKNREANWLEFDLIPALRDNSLEWPFSSAYLHHIEPNKEFTLNKPRQDKRKILKRSQPDENTTTTLEEGKENAPAGASDNSRKEEPGVTEEEMMMSEMNGHGNGADMNGGNEEERGNVVGESEAMDVPLRPEEKRRLNWDGGLYLAPLTTVGNLPFRRLCTTYGATITCSEMALAQPLVTGHTDEFALIRKHESEKLFGVQLAGGYANRMVPAAELIAKKYSQGVDFVDVNLGCPIDLVFNQGAGSAMLDAPGRLGKVLVGMNKALGEIPLTVKFRMGVANNKPNAHKLIPRFATEWGVSAMTLHGRSRQQRYSKLADWAYIKQCSQTLRDSLADANLPPVPIFGNGDCFSAQSYYEEKENAGVDGVMVARGALIKPWIFREIEERREWDISARERLDGIRQFAEFGLSHWGSDTQGVSNTRRFLCEFLSFTHRYVPIGLLERMPPMLNERPPAYKGRNELETLLASPFAGDWVKISEMFLGKAEDAWKFTPKHKSNAYGGEEAQG